VRTTDLWVQGTYRFTRGLDLHASYMSFACLVYLIGGCIRHSSNVLSFTSFDFLLTIPFLDAAFLWHDCRHDGVLCAWNVPIHQLSLALALLHALRRMVSVDKRLHSAHDRLMGTGYIQVYPRSGLARLLHEFCMLGVLDRRLHPPVVECIVLYQLRFPLAPLHRLPKRKVA